MSTHTEFDSATGLGSPLMPSSTGSFHWFNDESGFGFITPDDGDREVFVHCSEIAGNGGDPLKYGQRVSYRLGPALRPGRRQRESTCCDGHPCRHRREAAGVNHHGGSADALSRQRD